MSDELPVPEALADVTPEWLTAALTEAAVLRGGRVAAAHSEQIGQLYGFTGVIGRVRLRYEDSTVDAPPSLIAKLPMARVAASGYHALQERDAGRRLRYFERCAREVAFYQRIGAAFAPDHYYSAVDDESRRVVLLLEDVSGGRQGDVLRGCSVDDAARMIDALAPFHALWWGEPAGTRGFPAWDDDPRTRQKRYAARIDSVLATPGPQDVLRILDRLRSRLGAVTEMLNLRGQTLIHGDLHLDNVVFAGDRGGRPFTALDWQTASVGPPAWDLALFLTGSLSVDDRRAAEDELLGHYVKLLATRGVRGYGASDLRLEYRLALLVLLAGTAFWLASVDPAEANSRERALGDAALATDGRLVSAIRDHELEALLDEVA
ncbi:MAG TPA: phosphotransferase [Gaiellaceae bacterium]